MKRFAIIAWLMLALPCSGQDVAAAARDLASLPPGLRQHIRYLSLIESPKAERFSDARVLSGHCNGLSRETDIKVPEFKSTILRINLIDTGWPCDLWDSLADRDPYYHVKLKSEPSQVKWWGGGEWAADGRYYPPYSFQYRTAASEITAIARWLSDTPERKAATAYLVAETRSRAPILHAAWFFNQTAAAQDRKPNYYDFLGVKNEKDFQALVGFDSTKKRRKVEIREAVADSGVTLQARGIIRETAEDGGYWVSLDVRKALDKLDPLRVLGKDLEDAFRAADVKDVASEQYGHLPNGMWGTFLGNNKGERQATAPDFIASDGASRSNDKRVHVNVSCIRCHVNGGLQDIDGWTRNLFQSPLNLQSPDYAVARLLRQQYARKLEPFIERDRLLYATSVKEATGWSAKEYAAKYAEYWERYEDAKVDAAWAARDLGMSEAGFIKSLGAYLLRTGSLDTVLSVFLLKGDRKRTISIRQWEATYPVAQLVVRGYQP